MKMSEIFDLAADEHLLVNEEDFRTRNEHKTYASCNAINEALFALKVKLDDPIRRKIITFLESLGLSKHEQAFYQFMEYPLGERQQIRYTWLKMCALWAQEEGL